MTKAVSQAERAKIIAALIAGRYSFKVTADGAVEADPVEVTRKPGNDFDFVDMKR